MKHEFFLSLSDTVRQGVRHGNIHPRVLIIKKSWLYRCPSSVFIVEGAILIPLDQPVHDVVPLFSIISGEDFLECGSCTIPSTSSLPMTGGFWSI